MKLQAIDTILKHIFDLWYYSYLLIPFAFGFGIFYLTGPATALFALFLVLNKRVYLPAAYVRQTSLMVLFISIYYFLLFYDRGILTQVNPIKNMLTQIFYLVLCGLASIQLPRFAGIPFVGAFITGQLVYMLIIVSHSQSLSYDSAGRLYGYGSLFNPILNDTMNSPAVGSNIAIASCFFIFLFIASKSSLVVRILFLLPLALSIPSGIYTGARTFFIVSIVGLVLAFLNPKNFSFRSRLILSLILILFIFYVVNYLFIDFELNQFIDFYLQRFENSDISSDSRTALLYEGLDLLFSNPLGGFESNIHIWFHNFFLDTARLGGIPLLLIVTAIFFKPTAEIVRSIKQGFTLLPFMAFVALIVLFQDVTVEGNFFPLFLFYIISFSKPNIQKLPT